MTVAGFASVVGSSTCGYWSAGMSSSSVYLTPCWAGKYPLIRVERAGEHMQALVNARWKSTPWRSRRLIPGRFLRNQSGGKCWIARS